MESPERSPEFRLPLELLKRLAEEVKQDFDLPNVFLSGSQSPKYPKPPRRDSDIDFVSFPLDYRSRRKHYEQVSRRWRIERSKHPLLNGRWVCIGVFDPKDPENNRRLIKGKPVNWWRRYNLRLA
jgi:hypothetical protein